MYFAVFFVFIFSNNFASLYTYDVNFDSKGIFCYICDSSEDPTCYEPTQSMADICGTKNKCFSATVKNDLAGRDQIIRGCTKYSEGAEKHQCEGVENQENCLICDSDQCNRVANFKVNISILTVLFLIVYFM